MAGTLNVTIRVWRQAGPDSPGGFVDYQASGVSEDASFLEVLDLVNEDLIGKGEDPIAFDSDCREGICGSCNCVVAGVAHGPESGTTTCQLYMRQFSDGEVITVEPWRAKAFPIIKDLVVDRSAFDRIMAAGGYVSVGTGAAPDANETPVPKDEADLAFEAAACIGCGACVAACKNASASLFVGAKIDHLARMPQGQAERYRRAERMVAQMEAEGFGACTNEAECQAVCPKEISTDVIQRMNRDFMRAALRRI
ncbi:MAG: succinate dehydrogenase/fumarate reductase iron-sulfur subunit [Deltaproteobacteria bacterium]